MHDSNTLTSIVKVYDKNNNDITDLASITYSKNGNEVVFTIKYQGKTQTKSLNVS